MFQVKVWHNCDQSWLWQRSYVSGESMTQLWSELNLTTLLCFRWKYDTTVIRVDSDNVAMFQVKVWLICDQSWIWQHSYVSGESMTHLWSELNLTTLLCFRWKYDTTVIRVESDNVAMFQVKVWIICDQSWIWQRSYVSGESMTHLWSELNLTT